MLYFRVVRLHPENANHFGEIVTDLAFFLRKPRKLCGNSHPIKICSEACCNVFNIGDKGKDRVVFFIISLQLKMNYNHFKMLPLLLLCNDFFIFFKVRSRSF